jgi:RNA polymerase sigma-70 factor (ECF subfamily)
MAIVAPDHVDLGRDAALVERTQAGEHEAFEDLYRRYFPRLRRYCMRYLSDPADAEEVAQEALARAYRSIASLGGDKRFYPWLTVIAKRLCIDYYRRTSRLELTADIESGSLAAAADERIVDITDHQLVRNALQTLSPRHREVLERREVDGWSYQRIADDYGVSLGTVEQLLHRARKSLRKSFLELDRETVGAAAGFPFLGWLSRRWSDVRATWQLKVAKLEPVLSPLASRAAGLAMVAGAAGIGGGALAGAMPAAAAPAPRPAIVAPAHANSVAPAVVATHTAPPVKAPPIAPAGHGGKGGNGNGAPPPAIRSDPADFSVSQGGDNVVRTTSPLDIFLNQIPHDVSDMLTPARQGTV